MSESSNKKTTVLVVEDEEDIRELVTYTLQKDGYYVTSVATGEDAISAVASEQPSLILLDLLLPGIDGLAVCCQLRQREETAQLPIVMLTAKGEEDDVVRGLNAGANDYITKPFSRNVLLARVRAALRNWARLKERDTSPDEAEVIDVHNISIHPGRHEVSVDNQLIELSATEFRILEVLASKPGWVFTREQILDALHGGYYAITERTVDVHIASLRRRLGSAGQYVNTVRGIGYRLKDQ